MLLDAQLKAAIIQAALYSPSADNSQPWQYVWHDTGDLSIWSDPQLSGKATDQTYVLTDLAIGNVLEAIKLQAKSLGIDTELNYFPDEDPMHVAVVSFTSQTNQKLEADDCELAKYIADRHTDRRFPFSGKLDVNIGRQLSESLNDENCQLHTFTDRKEINNYLPLIKKAESIRFRAESLHSELFQTVNFEDPTPSQGMTLGMLGIEPFARPIFRYISTWRNMQKLNKIGASKMIAIRSVTLPIRLSPGLCLLTASGESRLDMVKAGQQMLRFWLAATKLGLSVHPYAAPGVLTLAKPALDPLLTNELSDVEKGLAEQLGASATAIMFFRIGFKKGLPIRSQRRNIDSMLKIVS
ncbi:nitroreductase family protein [Paraglaciecola arctica]|uniref:Nitroreductase domain-containing protein n=1 Tax=Paraglaciecola arctica BSs20135 TaxID=493475 RepID=K6YDG3_9ALTE|nr:hypothetical protein [Paraglaciecola arctica]GAC21986.1 hypothetical protein GARC_5051 [Paraglaciecola arctica BSs20135]